MLLPCALCLVEDAPHFELSATPTIKVKTAAQTSRLLPLPVAGYSIIRRSITVKSFFTFPHLHSLKSAFSFFLKQALLYHEARFKVKTQEHRR